MRSTNEIRRDFADALDREADATLSRFGFKRRRSKDDYVRRTAESVHTLIFRPNVKPRFHSGSDVYVYPLIWVEMPTIGAKALEIVGGNAWVLANAPGLLVNDPIDLWGGGAERGFWHATGKKEMRARVAEAVSFVERHALARLNALQTVQDFIRDCEAKGTETIAKGRLLVQLAAAYLLLGKDDAARRTLERCAADQGLREASAAISDYLTRRPG